MVKQSRPLYATFVTGGIGVIGASIAYLQPPTLFFGWAVGLFLSIVCPVGMFYWTLRQESQEENDIGDLSRGEIEEILGELPSLKDEKVRIAGSLLSGYKLLTTFRIRNSHSVVLDELEALIEVTDLERNTVKGEYFPIPDLAERETQELTFKMGLGRRASRKYKVILIVYRMGFEVARKHFAIDRWLFDIFQVSR